MAAYASSSPPAASVGSWAAISTRETLASAANDMARAMALRARAAAASLAASSGRLSSRDIAEWKCSACGITVAPMMPTASKAAEPSSGFGTRPRTKAGPSTPATISSATSSTTINANRTSSTGRNPSYPRTRSASSTKPKVATITAPHTIGIPNSRYNANAPPTSSARSVMITTSSAWIHRARRSPRPYRRRQFSARLRPVAMPSFAARYCTTDAVRLAPTTTQTSV